MFQSIKSGKGLPLGGLECRDSKKLVTMEFSSSKEPVLKV